MVSLLNDVILKTGLIERISSEQGIQWFKDIKFINIVINLLLPLLIVITVAFFLKRRYDIKKHREEITVVDWSQL